MASEKSHDVTPNSSPEELSGFPADRSDIIPLRTLSLVSAVDLEAQRRERNPSGITLELRWQTPQQLTIHHFLLVVHLSLYASTMVAYGL
ncbi:hypothetical protein HYALB_00001666 [Hymenoscyphus albidus]|uniref:Uncharacterized protein n=1 Tax=Hymenoscyphus albidus TaxID=595503 RepID=A0A9N9PRC2_9HELO|nr:hypothetical protein HYALB_00001666 [Hymenoscyphus albidus]